MAKLATIWAFVANKYGAIVAGVVILVILGIAYYLGYTPSQVLNWIGQ